MKLMQHSLEEILGRYDDMAPLAEASTLPREWYVDERVADLERQHVFGRTWQQVARAEQLASPGEFVTAEVAGEPLLVARGEDGELRAFYNVCRHHAAAVVTEPTGCASLFRCPYHGWTYDLEGRLKAVPEFQGVANFDRAQNGLVPVKVEAWESFVFVNLDPHSDNLASHLGSVAGRIAPLGLTSMKFAGRHVFTLKCNWKVFVDNYLDGGYHVPHLHKELNSVLDYKEYTIECVERWCLQSSPIAASGGGTITATVRQGRALYFWIYPNLMLNWYEGYLDTNLVRPLGIDRMEVVFDFYFADVSDAAREHNQHSKELSRRIQDEDQAICESVQRGLSSKTYDAGRLSARREAGEHLFHRLLAREVRKDFGS